MPRGNASRVLGCRDTSKTLQDYLRLEWEESENEIRDYSREELRARMLQEANECLAARLEEIGEEPFLEVARMYLLRFTDTLWKNHLLAMDRLRQGVHVRSYGQRNPLLEYKREAYHMYLLMDAMRDEQLLEKLCLADEGNFHGGPASARVNRWHVNL